MVQADRLPGTGQRDREFGIDAIADELEKEFQGRAAAAGLGGKALSSRAIGQSWVEICFGASLTLTRSQGAKEPA